MHAWITWAYHRISYWLRPYDMLADRRRWFWRPRQRCWSWHGKWDPADAETERDLLGRQRRLGGARNRTSRSHISDDHHRPSR